ncbi:signal peptidase I [Erysipelotrichaceae bacterium 51-3]
MSKKPDIKTRRKAEVSPENSIKRRRRRLIDKRDIKNFIVRLVGLAAMIYVLFFLLFRIIPVPNDDMKPTLRSRDLQLVYRMPSTLWNNDIICYEKDSLTRTGRIVARPGDTVEITENSTLRVNNSEVYEGDIYYSTPAYDNDIQYPLTLADDEYFILSDFREGARDSRQFGPVKKDEIIGKVITVLRRSGL